MSQQVNFRRFEPFIKEAVEAYPTPVEITMPHLAFNSVLTYLRQAKSYLEKNPRTITEIDYASFMTVTRSLVVFEDVGKIFLGQRRTLSAAPAATNLSQYAGEAQASDINELMLMNIMDLYDADILLVPFKVNSPDKAFLAMAKRLAEDRMNLACTLRGTDLIIS